MPEEKTSNAEKSAKVTNADLEASLEGLEPEVEEKVVELKEKDKEIKKEIKEVKEELRDKDGLTQAERSNMGRRLKKLEETQDTVLSTLNELKELTQSRITREDKVDKGDAKGLPEYVSTPKDVMDIEDWVEEQNENYERDYMKVIGTLSKKNPEDHEAIFEEMKDNFNIRRGKKRNPNTWNPYMDAQLNYSEAKAAFYAKKAANPTKPKPNVKGKEPLVSTNLTIETESEVDEAGPAVQLDDLSSSFLKSIGKDSDWARKAMR